MACVLARVGDGRRQNDQRVVVGVEAQVRRGLEVDGNVVLSPFYRQTLVRVRDGGTVQNHDVTNVHRLTAWTSHDTRRSCTHAARPSTLTNCFHCLSNAMNMHWTLTEYKIT